MTATELLAHLKRLEIRVWVEGDRLRLSTPKGAISPELRAELAERKAELIALLNATPDAPNRVDTIRPAERVGEGPFVFPLSSAQERMWFLEQLESTTANQIVMAHELVGALDSNALRQALDGLVQRHEALRTTFRALEGRAVQVVAATGAAALEVRAVESQAEVAAVLAEEAQRPFDLERGPLLRTLLLALDPARHVLVVTLHHIISDGWSLGVFLSELSVLYEAALRHVESPLPPLPIQYADYARWQREWLAGEALADQLAYWRGQLQGTLPVLELPTDHPRPPVERHRGERFTVSLSAVTLPQLQPLARRENATPFMVLLAAFTTLLARYTGQEDVLVGTPVAGRNRPELEGLIGLFLNTVVLRTDTSGDPSFLELFRRVRETAIGAYANQDVPFERLVEELRPERDPSRNPVFQVMFDLQNMAPPTPLPGLELRPVAVDRGAAQFDLTLSIVIYEGRLHTQWEYSTDLFDRATIERMARHYEQLLVAVVADPAAPLSQLPLRSAEDERVLAACNDTAVAHDRDRCVHQLLEISARATPAAPAVRAGGVTLSYGALDARANQLAHLLVRRGVTPGARVAICLDRTVDLPVALAAVLKAGAAYVPLDPTHPAERLQYTLEDADVACTLTLAHFASGLAPGLAPARAPLVRLDEVEAELAALPATPVAVATHPEDVAYVIYTSGSTGRPKGVEVEHRNVVAFLEAMRRAPGCTAEDVLLAVTTVAFDIAGLELWLPLSVGGRVVLASRTDVLDAERLMALLEEQRVTLLQATPATWRLLVDAGWAGKADLKALCGGEALPRDLAAALVPRVAELWNMYGPTETTIWSTVSRVVDTAGAVPIGRPIANTRVYVLEPSGPLAPMGVPGELCIGGEGVARGYRQRPALTAEKFVMITLPGGRTERVYRTGDVARFRSDGELEFLGRRDHQVKLRGYRIELGEIEAVLATHPGVKECVVTVREDHPGDQRLVGYVVADAEASFDAEAAREALRAKLPEYMVPNAFMTLPALPLTPNGKIDRKALPMPEARAPRAAAVADALMTPVQRRVAGIWQDVLHVDRVGLHDNFFALGGHSLLLVKLHVALNREFNGDLTIVELFQRTTVAAQADRLTSTGPADEAIRRARAEDARQVADTHTIPLVARVGEGPFVFPLSSAQERMWFLEQLESTTANQIVMAHELVGALDTTALREALDGLVQRHETLRTTFRAAEGRPVQVIAAAGAVGAAALEVRVVGSQAEVDAALAAEAQRPFDLERGPLLRTLLLALDPARHVLVVTLHHIISDGWSLGVFLSELSALYEAALRHAGSPLPALPIQYADYARWQREWLAGEALADQLAYWRGQLRGTLPVLELPTDHPRLPVERHRGERITFSLSADLTPELHALARRENATPFMVLLAAFTSLLARYTGQEDVLVGTPVAGRNRPELEGLIGLFLNTVVLRTDTSGDPSFLELFRRVRETAIHAYANQDVPFERLVEELRPERDPSRNPVFQVMFDLQNMAPPTPLSGLEMRPVVVDRGAAQLDLTLSILTYEGRLHTQWEYSTDLFDRATIERLARHYEQLLVAVVADPAPRLSLLPLLTAAERRQVVEQFNATAVATDPATFVRRFERHAALTPDACAVRFEGCAMTYGELNQRANQVAYYLHTLGIAPGALVGICLPRSLALVVALLGVQKAGGAYVPLDPRFPVERLGFMLADSGATVLVTADAAAAGVAVPAGVSVVDLGMASAALGAMSEADGAGGAGLQDPAYVIYTSGSTGRPKGVVVSHGALANFLESMQWKPGLTQADVLAAVTTISFDIAGLEVYLPLMVGARIELLSHETASDGNALAAQLAASGATVLQATPATWRLLLEAGWTGSPTLRAFCGGEALARDLADTLLECTQELWNLYGPTETTIWSTVERVERGEGPITVGRPIANTQVYVLDRQGEPVPIGMRGELWIGGAGVALGYHGRPELSAERFVPDHLGRKPGGRLYRTGDLGRWRADGRLEHLGRLDSQVKIRGFRIELGEIETAVARLPAVQQCVVDVRQERLVAYIVYTAGQDMTASEVRAFLRDTLPDYMVPSLVVALDRISLTPNGKVDRNALPDPLRSRGRTETGFQPPTTPTEVVFAGVWRELLGVERVSTTDNFFELGGHSLLAMRAVHQIQHATGWRPDARMLFFRTLGQIAAGRPGSPESPS